MKYMKILGLAAMAAMAITALIGAGTASANVLCTENKTPCPGSHPTEKKYIAGDVLSATAENATLTAEPEVQCQHSATSVKVTNPGNATTNVTGTVESLSFTNCTTFGGFIGCTVTVENIPYHAEITGVGATASLTVKTDGGGEPSARVSCAGIINCTFGSPTFHLGITGGNPATVFANEEELTISEAGGFGCPEEAFWDADYKATGTNTAAWVVKE